VRRLGPEDVSAEVFVVAFRNRERFDQERSDARPWLYGIATNPVGQHRRSERRGRWALAHADGGRVSAPCTACA
jgi:DNA-directed RNA polymerase specialized sigma24 family protein